MADYEGLDLSEIMKESKRVNAEPSSGGSDDYLEKFVRLPDRDGFVHLRILPRKKGCKHYCATRVHTLTNPSQRDQYGKPKTRTYHCPKTFVQTDKGSPWQGDCIICKYYSDLWQKSEQHTGKERELMQQQARAIKPVERYYYAVIVRSEQDYKTKELKKNVGPKIYSCGKTVHAKICLAIAGDEKAGEDGLGDITHPLTGRDFKLVKKVVRGGGGVEYPSYDNSKFEDVSPAGSREEIQRWIENLPDLQSLRVIKNADELKHALKVHLGMIKEAEEEEEDELADFRPQAQSRVAETVKEELITHSSSEKKSSDNVDDIDVMADDDFLDKMNSIDY